MVDDIGQRGDVAVASLIAEVHNPDRCRDCAAGRCEIGADARQVLAGYRARREAQSHRTVSAPTPSA